MGLKRWEQAAICIALGLVVARYWSVKARGPGDCEVLIPTLSTSIQAERRQDDSSSENASSRTNPLRKGSPLSETDNGPSTSGNPLRKPIEEPVSNREWPYTELDQLDQMAVDEQESSSPQRSESAAFSNKGSSSKASNPLRESAEESATKWPYSELDELDQGLTADTVAPAFGAPRLEAPRNVDATGARVARNYETGPGRENPTNRGDDDSGKQLAQPPVIKNDIVEAVNMAGTSAVLAQRDVVTLSLSDLIMRTLANSNRVKILGLRPSETRQSVAREYGRFDWRSFVENRILYGEIPVQASNEVSGPQSVIRQEEVEIRWGVRKRTVWGGQFEISDRFGLRDDNSGILRPPEQGLGVVSLSYQQELLRNAGRDINLSPALVASYRADSVHAESVAEISDRLQEVVNLYWALFEQRGRYFVWQALVHKAKDVLQQLEERRNIDAQENMIAQARALMLEAEAQVAEARVQILIAQDELRRVVNDPALEVKQIEIIPAEAPHMAHPAFNETDELSIALRNRGEIHRAIANIRAAATRHHVALNQLLPRLTFVLETSANGLDGDYDIAGATRNAFDHDPLVQAELNLEFFIGNRRAKATARQAELAIARVRIQYEDEIEAVKLDVRNAVNTLNGATQILDLRYRTLDQRAKELDFIRYRYSVIPQAGASKSLLLEQYFLALNRLVFSQLEYFNALTSQQQALIDLQRAKGVLVRSTDVAMDSRIPVPRPVEAHRLRKNEKPYYLEETHQNVVVPSRHLD